MDDIIYEPRPNRSFELRGSNFEAPGVVLISGKRAELKSWRKDRIVGKLPDDAHGFVDIVVLSGLGVVLFKDRVEADR